MHISNKWYTTNTWQERGFSCQVLYKIIAVFILWTDTSQAKKVAFGYMSRKHSSDRLIIFEATAAMNWLIHGALYIIHGALYNSHIK